MIALLSSLLLLAPTAQEPDGALPPDPAPATFSERHSSERRNSVRQGGFADQRRDDDPHALEPSASLAKPLSPLSVPVFGEHDDGTWVRTQSYKARFAPGGMTFIPFLGVDATRNHPLELRLASATVGEHQLRLTESGKVQRDGHVMTIDRGAVDVRYDVRQGEIEQLFYFDDALPMNGALVLTLDVDTQLVGHADGGGFLFQGPEGGVHYSGAVAIDGDGRRIEAGSIFEDGKIRIDVPAWFIERGRGHIIVDPVLTTWTTSAITGADDENPDIAYDRTSNTFCTVFELAFSSGDYDVLASTTTVSGGIVTAFVIDNSSADVRRPQIAGHGASDQFLTVAERFDGPDGRHEIVGRLYDAQSSANGSLFTVAGTGLFTTWTNRSPDVGGNSSTASGTMFAVVFEREFLTGSLTGTTAGRSVTVFPDGTLGPTRTLETESGATLSGFCISKSTSDPSLVDVWNVAYVRTGPGAQTQIRGLQLNADGTEASAPNELLGFGNGQVPTRLDVSDALPLGGGAPRYLVVYDTPQFIDGGANVMVCQDNSIRDLFNLRNKEAGSRLRRRQGPSVTITYEEFIVAYHEQNADGTWNARIANLDYVGGNDFAVAEARVPISLPYSEPTGKVALASRATGGVFSRRTGVAFSGRRLSSSRRRVTTGIFDATSPYSPAAQYCTTQQNSTGENGFLRFFGSRPASTTKTVTAVRLPPQQFALLVVGTANDIVIGVGGGQGNLCVGGTIGRYNDQVAQIDATGAVSFSVNPAQIPQGGNLVSASAGDSFYFQTWHRDLTFGGAQTSNLSNAAKLTFN